MILNDYTRIEVNSQINIIFYSFLITIIIIIVSFNSNTRMLSENKCVVCWQNWYPKLKRWAQHIENTITCAVITISLWARDVSPPKYIYIWNVAIISPHSCIVANYPHSIYCVNERIRNAWINAHFYLKFYKIIFCTFFSTLNSHQIVWLRRRQNCCDIYIIWMLSYRADINGTIWYNDVLVLRLWAFHRRIKGRLLEWRRLMLKV